MGFAPAMATWRQRSRKALVSLPNIEVTQTKKAAARRRPLAEGKRRRLFLDLARTNLDGPLAGRYGTVLDKLLEALAIVLDASRGRLHQRVGNLTGCALRRCVLDRELHYPLSPDGVES